MCLIGSKQSIYRSPEVCEEKFGRWQKQLNCALVNSEYLQAQHAFQDTSPTSSSQNAKMRPTKKCSAKIRSR